MSRKARLLAAMVALTVLLAALAAAFDQVARVPVLTHPLSGNDPGTGGSEEEGSATVAEALSGNDTSPLLQLLGIPGTSYLKLMAYEIGSDGTWYPLTGGQQSLSGGNASVGTPANTDFMSNRTTLVRLLRDVTGPMPTFESTYRIGNASGDLLYDSGSGVLVATTGGKPTYLLSHQQPKGANMSTLESLTCTSGNDQELPPQLEQRLNELSDLVCANLTSPFAKAMALARFLSSSYTMTEGEDNGTLAEFLFGDRTGDSQDFATAFTLLLRSQDISARPCLTFKIDPNLQSQTVSPDSLSYAVEINFDQLGWVMLDPASAPSDGTLHNDGSIPNLNPIFPDRPVNLAGIYGIVFLDSNNDSVMQPREAKVSGVGVQLLSSAGALLETTQTDDNGHYLFTGVQAGSYLVHLIGPQDHVMTAANDRPFVYAAGLAHAFDMGIRSMAPQDGREKTVTSIISATPDIRKGVPFIVTGTCMATPAQGVLEPIDGTVLVYLVRSKGVTGDRYCCGEGEVQNGYYAVTCGTPDEMPTGNYQLIVYYLGDVEHEASDSDPSVRVLDSTDLLLETHAPAVAGSSITVNATLRENASGHPVVGATVSFDIIAPWGHSTTIAVTGVAGAARMTIPLNSAGEVWIEARFAGTALLNASSASIELISLQPSIVLDGGSLLRGQEGTVFGRLSAGGMPLPVVAMSMSSDLGSTVQTTTTGLGVFAFRLIVPANALLGVHSLDIAALGTVADFEIPVVSATKMIVTYDGTVASVLLVDDKGQGLSDKELSTLCGASTSQLSTGTTGVGQFRPAASGNHSIYFAGDQRYAASIAYLNVDAPTTFQWWPLLVVGVAVLIMVFLLARRRKSTSAVPRRGEGSRGPYQIGFPQILHPMPPVWGAGEPLKIAVQGRPGPVRLRIDGKEGEDLDLQNGIAYTSRTLERGSHHIEVEGPDGYFQTEVRIVDYREEVVVLYAGAFDSWRNRGRVEAHMTPQEALGRLAQEGVLPRARAEVLFSTFEYAEFSLRPIRREDYERMYLVVAEASA